MNLASVLAQIERTQTAAGRQQSGRFSAEGLRLNERAIRAGVLPETAVCSKRFLAAPTPCEQALIVEYEQASIPLHSVPDSTMDQLVQGRSYGGIIGLYRLLTPPILAEVAAHPCILLVTNNVRDPGNLGALCRTAHALNAAALITLGGSAPFAPKTVRTSMGSLFKLPILRYETADSFLAECKALGIVTVGSVSEKGIPLADLRLADDGKTAVFLGNEYHGLSDGLLAKLDHLATIPMTSGIDSLSINAAAAILLYALGKN